MSFVTAKAARTNKKAGRTASKEVRRRQLIQATIESISRYGISGTTTTTVTGFAGLSNGIVNFHFKNKETLFEETLRFLAEEHRDLWQVSVAEAGPTPEAKLRAIVDTQFHPRLCTRKKLAVWFGFYGETRYRAAYRRIMSEIDAERWRISAELCRRIIENGNYEQIEAEDIASTLEGLYDGFWLNILIYPDEFPREDAWRQTRKYLASIFPDHFGDLRKSGGES